MQQVPKSILLVHAQGEQYAIARRLAKRMAGNFAMASVPTTFTDTGEAYDLAIAIGGDGTMMKTVTALAHRGIPTLGVNAGDVGFLTSAEASDAMEVMLRVTVGDYEIESRLGLELHLNGEVIGPIANEIVLRHNTSVATYQIAIGGQVFYQDLMGDGIMVATATGSTGYNTSAGGPILLPGSGNVVVTPLNPMSLSTRSIVSQELADGKDIEVTLVSSKRDEAVKVIADGLTFESALAVGGSVSIRKYKHPMLFATFGLGQYARALTEKKGFAR